MPSASNFSLNAPVWLSMCTRCVLVVQRACTNYLLSPQTNKPKPIAVNKPVIFSQFVLFFYPIVYTNLYSISPLFIEYLYTVSTKLTKTTTK